MNNTVQVIYASQRSVIKIDVHHKKNMTAEMAIESSDILSKIAELEQQESASDNVKRLDLATTKIGVFGETIRLGHILEVGDRVEIYRELVIDPKQARRQRALLKNQ